MKKKKNNYNTIIYALFLLLMLFFSACTGTKHLSEGERFYTGADIRIEKEAKMPRQKTFTAEMAELLIPEPNMMLFGSRPRVWLYHLAGDPKKETGFASFVKNRLGEAPVLMQDANEEMSASTLENFLWNKGFFQAYVESDIELKGETKGSITYTVYPGTPYRLRRIIYPRVDSVYALVLEQIQEESLLDSGQLYDVDRLVMEQKRIEELVMDQGFYAFNDDYLVYLADSTAGDHQVDLTFNLSESTPPEARWKYEIDSVNIFPGYTLTGDTIDADKRETYRRYVFIKDPEQLKKEVLTNHINFGPGDIYTKTAEKYTLEHLYNLGVFKFVNLKFDETDSAKLTSNIFLTMQPKKSLRLEVQAVSKSNNFVGPEVSVSYLNRNALYGAELLEISASGSYDVQLGGLNQPPLNAFEVNLQSSLTFPRLVLPFNLDYYNRRFIPKTQVRAALRLQSRVNVFTLNSFETGYGFIWRESTTKSHQLFPINISYLRLSNVSEEFERRLNQDQTLRRSLDNQFILGNSYTYEWNTKLADSDDPDRFRWNNFFFNGLLDLSGNLLNMAQRAVGDQPSEDGNYKIFRSPYSQYVKASADFRYYRQLSRTQELAAKIMIGAARALGNSSAVPFIKQFSAGGSNGIRAFRARSLGPGSYNAEESRDESVFILDETGDFKIESSIEYRAPLAGPLEGAVFVDAGNIWLWETREKPGAKFKANTFHKEMAVGTGAGLRLNLGFFILRFDVAFPLRKPWLPLDERWVVDEINFLDRGWRRNNILYNIAFGYPF